MEDDRSGSSRTMRVEAERSCSRAEGGRRILSPGRLEEVREGGETANWVDHFSDGAVDSVIFKGAARKAMIPCEYHRELERVAADIIYCR